MKKGKWRRVETEGWRVEPLLHPNRRLVLHYLLPLHNHAQFTITSISDLGGEEGKR